MNLSLARQAVKAYPRHPLTSKRTTHHLRREWMRKIELLGDRWLLAKANYVGRRT